MIEELFCTSACRSARLIASLPDPPKNPPPKPPPLPGLLPLVPDVGPGVGDGDTPGVLAVAPATRVTRMSDPTLDSGDSTLSCALDRPCEIPISAMSSATPAASPRAVRMVRPRRRRNSL